MEAVTTAVTTAFTGMQEDILGLIVLAIPAIFVIVGVFFGIKKLIGFFKSTAK